MSTDTSHNDLSLTTVLGKIATSMQATLQVGQLVSKSIHRVPGGITMSVTLLEDGGLLFALYSPDFKQGKRPYFTLKGERGKNGKQPTWVAAVTTEARPAITKDRKLLPLHHVAKHIVPIFGEKMFYGEIADQWTAEAVQHQLNNKPASDHSKQKPLPNFIN